ncbi:cysteine-rich CWC family protein [Bradyrhizobium sp. 2S1]|nr:cysteine-rich CWC family protein [Bradyrhizobium sp. 2S1]
MDLSSNDRSEQTSPRRLACTACGSDFSCSLGGPCWCSDEDFRLPLPTDGGDCLCPSCLRKLAKQQATVGAT